MRVAGREVKSKEARNPRFAEVEGVGVLELASGSSFGRFASAESIGTDGGRFRESRPAALRLFSSARAWSMRMACWVRVSLICPTYAALEEILNGTYN